MSRQPRTAKVDSAKQSKKKGPVSKAFPLCTQALMAMPVKIPSIPAKIIGFMIFELNGLETPDTENLRLCPRGASSLFYVDAQHRVADE
jgi:hypothetical protein